MSSELSDPVTFGQERARFYTFLAFSMLLGNDEGFNSFV
jgi:hypothetical protein